MVRGSESGESINTLKQTSGCEAGDFVGAGGKPGIGIKLRVDLSRGTGYQLYVKGIMDKSKFVFGCETGLDLRKAAEFLFEESVDHTQAVGALGMAHTGVVLKVAVVFDDRKR